MKLSNSAKNQLIKNTKKQLNELKCQIEELKKNIEQSKVRIKHLEGEIEHLETTENEQIGKLKKDFSIWKRRTKL